MDWSNSFIETITHSHTVKQLVRVWFKCFWLQKHEHTAFIKKKIFVPLFCKQNVFSFLFFIFLLLLLLTKYKENFYFQASKKHKKRVFTRKKNSLSFGDVAQCKRSLCSSFFLSMLLISWKAYCIIDQTIFIKLLKTDPFFFLNISSNLYQKQNIRWFRLSTKISYASVKK